MSLNRSEIGQKQVFFDNKGRRGQLASYLGLGGATIITILVIFFIISVLINPFLPQIRLRSVTASSQEPDIRLPIPDAPVLSRRELQVKQESEKVKLEKTKRDEQKQQRIDDRILGRAARTARVEQTGPERPISVGFFVNWDDTSFASLQQNINALDWVVPEWIRLSGNEADPLTLDIDQKAVELIQSEKPDMRILPLLQNYKNEKWDTAGIAAAIGTPASRQKLISSLLQVIDDHKFGGITIDIEEVSAADQLKLFEFIKELHTQFQQRGLIVAQAVPFDNPDWNYKAFSTVNDYLMLMAYDQHWSTSEPGAIAGQDWYESVLKKRMAELSPAKTIVCFGNYGYDWVEGQDEAEDVSFQEAVLAAKESLDSPADIKFDPDERNPHFSYTEDDGKDHNIWFLDAVTAFDQIQAAERYKVGGLALWRLGSEDPSLWKIFGSDHDNFDPTDVKTISYGYDVDFEGTGEILQVKAEPKIGQRQLTIDDKGAITGEVYAEIPSSYVIQRTGDKPGKIALTFDDGPDPNWTPKILDILAAKGVKATFFIVGQNGQANPCPGKTYLCRGA